MTPFQKLLSGLPLVALGMVLLFGFDRLLKIPLDRGRWFAVHAFANLLVTMTALPGVLHTLLDPNNGADSTVFVEGTIYEPFAAASIYPICLVVSVHLYHMVAFNDLTKSDWFHHLLFVPLIGGGGMCYEWGGSRNLLSFFISGFPGGMDYFFLVLVKYNMIDRLQQKKYCSNLNVYCRCPGIIISGFILYTSMLYGKMPGIPYKVSTLIAVLAVYNCLYYCEMAVANYNMHLVLGRPNKVRSSRNGSGIEVPVQEGPSHPLIEEPEKAEHYRKKWEFSLKRMGS